jgi:uncharacterized membrane protein YwzB
MYTSILYSLTLIFFFLAYFYILRAIKIERFFQQGKVFEIRLAYILFSFMFASISTFGIWQIIEQIKNSIS